jgi:hypothetical protein
MDLMFVMCLLMGALSGGACGWRPVAEVHRVVLEDFGGETGCRWARCMTGWHGDVLLLFWEMVSFLMVLFA